MTIDSDSNDAAAIITSTEELTAAALEPQQFTDIPDYHEVLVPSGWQWLQVDRERYAEFPRRKRSNIALTTTASLAQYLREHRETGTTVYADGDALTVTAVVNDHGKETPGHRDHRATLTLQRTPGAERWLNANGKYYDQEAFAQLVEDGQFEIIEPEAATTLEIVSSMHGTVSAQFRQATRLSDGQFQFQYVENQSASAGAQGNLTIPEIITLRFAPFYGAAQVDVKARLRYRMKSGGLALGVWLIRADEILRESFDAELAELKDLTADGEQDGLVALAGTPGE